MTTFALHPPPYAVDDAALERDTEVETFCSGGPGGQHKNKTQTAVRLKHRPSGLLVVATSERSLRDNLAAAFANLRRRLEKLNFVPKKRRPTKPGRAAVARRLDEKSRRKSVKLHRGKPRHDD